MADVEDTIEAGETLFRETMKAELDALDSYSPIEQDLTNAPLHLIPDLMDLMEGYLQAAMGRTTFNLLPAAIARCFEAARYAHHAAGILQAVKAFQEKHGVAINWCAVYVELELSGLSSAGSRDFETSHEPYTAETPLVQKYTDAVVVYHAIRASNFPSPRNWQRAGHGYYYKPMAGTYNTTSWSTLSPTLFPAYMADESWGFFSNATAVYLLGFLNSNMQNPVNFVYAWQDQQLQVSSQQGQAFRNHAVVEIVHSHTSKITVKEFVTLLRRYSRWRFVDMPGMRQVETLEMVDLVGPMSWWDFLRAIMVTRQYKRCHLTFLPLPLTYHGEVHASLKDLYVELILEAEERLIHEHVFEEDPPRLCRRFLSWGRERGAASYCLRQLERVIGVPVASDVQVCAAGGYEFAVWKWDKKEWVVPTKDDWYSGEGELIAKAKAHIEYLLEHRPRVLSAAEADQLLKDLATATEADLASSDEESDG